jgi:hypothetical protein
MIMKAIVPIVTVGVCVAVLGDRNVTKGWTVHGTTIDCPVLLFSFSCKSLWLDVLGIHQREKGILQTLIGLELAGGRG